MMYQDTLKVFLLEDAETDRLLIKRQVLKVAPKAIFTIATNKQEFLEKINWHTPDVILADYYLPDFTGLDALLFVKEKIPQTPVIFITGALDNEEKVAETILNGAAGYVLKGNWSGIQTVLTEVFERNQAVIKEQKKLQKIARQKELLLLKATELLQAAPSFEGKVAILESMQKIQQLP